MRVYCYGVLLAGLVAPLTNLRAQSPVRPAAEPLPPLVDSRVALGEGVALYDQDNHQEAIARYLSVLPGDTLYPTVQSELAATYLAAKRPQEAADAARRALALHVSHPQPYMVLAAAEEELKHPELAQAAYDVGLKRFPYYQLLWFNQAATQQEARQYDAAWRNVQRSLQLNPAHPGSHFLLANLAARQDQPSHAMLSLLVYLFLAPDGPRSHDMLVSLEQQALRTAEVAAADRIPPLTPNAAFEELDLLLNSKVALRPDYVSKVKFDAALVKQTQLLVEKFPAGAAPAHDFWLRLYAPLVEALRQADHLTTFTYVVLTSADDPKAAKWVKSNKSKVEKLYAALMPALLRLRDEQPVTRAGQTATTQGWFDNDGRLKGLGEGTIVGEEQQFTGPWVFVTDVGAVEEDGSFGPDFKRTGVWRSYHDNGQLARTATYEHGERQGSVREFHDNGQPSLDATFARDQTEGEMKLYDYCGQLSETRTFRAGNLDGPYTTYFPSGKPRLRVQTRNDQQEGPQTTFYPDGSVEVEYTYAAGQKQGPFQVNYADHSPEKRGAYDHDELHGPYTEYFSNGQAMTTGAFEHGKPVGAWQEFFADGKPSVEKTFDAAGELHGTYHDYNYAGQLFCRLDYEHGRLVRQRYYDPATGRELQNTPIKKGHTAVQLLGMDGQPGGRGAYLNGQMDGEWRWTYANGQPQRVRHYRAGQLHGPAEDYYANGQLKQRTSYADGAQDGPAETFLRDGQRQHTGYYRAGQQHGPWRTYYPGGPVSEEYTLHHGQRNGATRSYAPNGRLTEERTFDFGRRRLVLTYDSLGRALNRVELHPATKELAVTYPNGKVRYRAAVGCYENRGPATWYSAAGRPEATATFVADQRDGAYKAYHPNGKVAWEGLYRAGQREGEWRQYYASGQLRWKGTYRQDELNGETQSYFENGQLEAQHTYLYGAAQGAARLYNPAGELLLERLYERGDVAGFRDGRDPAAPWQRLAQMAGNINVAFANGRPAATETVRAGVLDGTRTSYYSSGQVFRRMSYQEGLLSGPLTSFYPNGKPMEQETYLHDERHGRCRYYRPDGSVEREETYRHGEQFGPTMYFNGQGKPIKTEHYWNGYVYDAK